jgi:hypothetical protein
VAQSPVTETHALDHRARDDNAVRQAGYFALYDWLFGNDPQWLVNSSADSMYYSHDHGHYFPGNHNWSIAQLTADRDTPNPLPFDAMGLDSAALESTADRIEMLTWDELAAELSDLPLAWPVTDDELAALVDFADHRRHAVVARLRALLQP